MHVTRRTSAARTRLLVVGGVLGLASAVGFFGGHALDWGDIPYCAAPLTAAVSVMLLTLSALGRRSVDDGRGADGPVGVAEPSEGRSRVGSCLGMAGCVAAGAVLLAFGLYALLVVAIS